MDVTPLIPEGRQIIQRYAAEGFRVNGTAYNGAVIVMPTRTWDWAAPGKFADLTADHFADLAAMSADLDVVLIGAGATGQFFPPALRAALRERGLVIDCMDTGAACRTYNVLMAEGRRLAACLMPL